MPEKLIGYLAAQFGVNPRTLRYYEALRLLPAPARTSGGYRVYGEDEVRRLAFITKAKTLGLTLKEIREILSVRENGKCPCGSVRRMLQEHVEHIDHQIAELKSLRVDLNAMLSGWPSNRRPNGKALGKAICPMIETRRGSRLASHITRNGGGRK